MSESYYEDLSCSMYPSSLLHTFGVNGKISGSIGAIGEMQDVLPIIHGPRGCGFHYRRSARRRHQPFYQLLSSDLTETDIISGGEEKLEQTIRQAWERYHPKLIFVIPTPISDILNDDIRSVTAKLRQEGIAVAGIQSELFSHRDKNYSRNRLKQIAEQKITGENRMETEIKGCGFVEALYALVEQVMEPTEKIPHSVNLETVGWGSAGSLVLREIEQFLNQCGITVHTWIPSASVEELRSAPAAELNIVRRIRWAKRMKQKFGTDYMQISTDGRYAGLEGICTFYRDVGAALHMQAQVEQQVLAARQKAIDDTRQAREELGTYQTLLLSRSISSAPFLLKQYAQGYGFHVTYLCIILTPESKQNLAMTNEMEQKLLARVQEAVQLYSPETKILLNPDEATRKSCFADVDAILGTGDFTMENQGAPVIHVRSETESLSFESYVRTVLRLRDRLRSRQEREDLLLGKMPFESRHYPLLPNDGGMAAKEMWSRMWLRRKEEQS